MSSSAPPCQFTRRQACFVLAALLGTGLAAPGFGQQATGADPQPALSGGYMVEIVVFKGAGGAAGEDLAVAARDHAQDSDSAAAEITRSAHFGELLPATRYRLNDVVARLNGAGHRVVAHVAWTQTASAWNSGDTLSADQVGLAAAGLSGQIQLQRGQYLHLGFNLLYAPPGGAHYHLVENRRVKIGERNYYDHPAVGIIALVTPAGAG